MKGSDRTDRQSASNSASRWASSPPRIGLALSGGGFRATAFGLGSLRALHDRGILDQVSVVSGISGGSLLAAMWAYGPDSFDEFEDTVTEIMRSGLQLELARRVVSPGFLARRTTGSLRSRVGSAASRAASGAHPYSRTDALAEAFAARPFGTRLLPDVTRPGLATVLSATDLTTTKAVRFGSCVSSCSHDGYGDIMDPITVADAVAASAAFPILLPALARTYDFKNRRTGEITQRDVSLTDGGVYDNLGLSPLLPGRAGAFTSHVYDLDYVIAVDAGRGRTPKKLPNLLPLRLYRSFDITYAKTQDGSRAQLNAAAQDGRLSGFVHPYLAMEDRKLPRPLADLVPREAVVKYKTNFSAVKDADLRQLTTRGEQLTRVLLAHYCPELV